MDDLTKGYQEAPEAAGEIDWPVPESDAPDIGPWIAFMRGEDLPSRGSASHGKKPGVFVGLRRRERSQAVL